MELNYGIFRMNKNMSDLIFRGEFLVMLLTMADGPLPHLGMFQQVVAF